MADLPKPPAITLNEAHAYLSRAWDLIRDVASEIKRTRRPAWIIGVYSDVLAAR